MKVYILCTEYKGTHEVLKVFRSLYNAHLTKRKLQKEDKNPDSFYIIVSKELS